MSTLDIDTVDPLHDIGSHVLVLEPERVSRLMPYHSPELRFGGSHREAFEI